MTTCWTNSTRSCHLPRSTVDVLCFFVWRTWTVSKVFIITSGISYRSDPQCRCVCATVDDYALSSAPLPIMEMVHQHVVRLWSRHGVQRIVMPTPAAARTLQPFAPRQLSGVCLGGRWDRVQYIPDRMQLNSSTDDLQLHRSRGSLNFGAVRDDGQTDKPTVSSVSWSVRHQLQCVSNTNSHVRGTKIPHLLKSPT